MPAFSKSPEEMWEECNENSTPINGLKLLQDRVEECARINLIHRDGSVTTEFIPFRTKPRILPEDIEMIKRWGGNHITDNK